MQIGDLVRCRRFQSLPLVVGVVVGFNEKGEGGKDFVHVLVGDEVVVLMDFDVEVINEV